jgi:hypothetical protein
MARLTRRSAATITLNPLPLNGSELGKRGACQNSNPKSSAAQTMEGKHQRQPRRRGQFVWTGLDQLSNKRVTAAFPKQKRGAF